ncbi:MAG: hypothetical protein E6767_13605 [Dysgonomonas sp.]|nr:hypothetical protein [Dysgonomonas sp.]
MGNFANEQDLIIQNNLPSRRWKIRRIRTAYDKKLRQIDKESTRVWNQIRDLGYEELKPPIQRGYKRLFVLTEETKYSKQADFYQTLLDKINTVWYSPHKTFRQRKRKISKWKYRYKNVQTLLTPDDWVFHNTKKFTEEEKHFFFPTEYYHAPSKLHCKKYVFIEPWRFRLRVVPNMITQVQIKDSELEQYHDELSDFLDKDKNQRRLAKMRGGYSYSWKKCNNEEEDRKKYGYNSLTNIPLYQIKEQYEEEKLWEYDQKN